MAKTQGALRESITTKKWLKVTKSVTLFALHIQNKKENIGLMLG